MRLPWEAKQICVSIMKSVLTRRYDIKCLCIIFYIMRMLDQAILSSASAYYLGCAGKTTIYDSGF